MVDLANSREGFTLVMISLLPSWDRQVRRMQLLASYSRKRFVVTMSATVRGACRKRLVPQDDPGGLPFGGIAAGAHSWWVS